MPARCGSGRAPPPPTAPGSRAVIVGESFPELKPRLLRKVLTVITSAGSRQVRGPEGVAEKSLSGILCVRHRMRRLHAAQTEGNAYR